MERVMDKLILLAFCAFVAVLLSFAPQDIVSVLTAISVTALFDVDTIPKPLRAVLPLAYTALCLFVPPFLLFLPLVSYDCFRINTVLPDSTANYSLLLRFAWLLPLLIGFSVLPPFAIVLLLVLSMLGCLRAWLSSRLETTLADYRVKRDELSATSQALENRNRDLAERQSLQLRLATLAERSRIAREIHDNVGHLLTRSVLQMEALQITHANNPELTAQLVDVSQTLHEAYETVRESVHGLHEESFELHTQLQVLARETENLPRMATVSEDTPLRVHINYDLQTESPPPAVSYSFLAIAREAFANVLKHSNATNINVSLLEFPGFYQMTVHDNGSNQLNNNPASSSTGGIGLATMEERARALGGVLHTSWNHGFKVFVSIPKEV